MNYLGASTSLDAERYRRRARLIRLTLQSAVVFLATLPGCGGPPRTSCLTEGVEGPGGEVTLSYPFYEWLAVQQGCGDWTVIDPPADGTTWRFEVASPGVFTLATMTSTRGVTLVGFIRTTYDHRPDTMLPREHKMSVTIVENPALDVERYYAESEYEAFAIHNYTTAIVPGQTPSLTGIIDVKDGVADILGTAVRGYVPVGYKLVRGITVEHDLSINLDFSGEYVAPLERSFVAADIRFRTKHGLFGMRQHDSKWYPLSSGLEPGDEYVAVAGGFKTLEHSFPAEADPPDIELDSDAVPDSSAEVAWYDGTLYVESLPRGDDHFQAQTHIVMIAQALPWLVWLDPDALGGSDAFALPDLSALEGWRPELSLHPEAKGRWQVRSIFRDLVYRSMGEPPGVTHDLGIAVVDGDL